MNIFAQVRSEILAILVRLEEEGLLPDLRGKLDAITAEPPRDVAHGEIATNAAMVIAGFAKKNPKEIAALLCERLRKVATIKTAEIAGPGFINLRLKQETWQRVIPHVLEEALGYGNSTMGRGVAVNIEYVSANPTGPMHIGHARGAVYGDVLALLMLKAGYNVTKEYYINDAGGQIDTLARSAHLRYREALGEKIGAIPEGMYPGEYLKAVGEAFAQIYDRKYVNAPEREWLPVIRAFAVDAILLMVREDLQLLGIEHDVFTSERKLLEEQVLEEALELLDKLNLIYKGVLEAPKGKSPEDWEPREQTLFRATRYGDDTDRPLRKSDGSATYFASDIAYHYDKIKRGFRYMVLVLGADHGGYVKRIKAAVAALSKGVATMDAKVYQLVNFLEDGKPFKMSKRAGSFLTVRDVVEAVGKEVVRFIMLTRRNDVVLDFDFNKVTEQSKDNPVFYVQYAHARACSVFRNAQNEIPGIMDQGFASDEKTLALLTAPEELNLIKAIAEWPRVVEAAARMHEPHRIAFYLQDLAGAFHALWNRGREDDSLRFIVKENISLTKARLALVKACALTVGSGLFVMGIEPVREM